MSQHDLLESYLLTEHRDAKDPKAMTEQILAIAPILPGQKVKPGFDIPPRTPSMKTHDQSIRQHDQKPFARPFDGGNDLISFENSAPNAKAIAANSSIPSQHRARSVSLMDDDRHINAMNEKMGHMHLMGPAQTPGRSSTRTEQALERTDTQTSEVDAFFDAEG